MPLFSSRVFLKAPTGDCVGRWDCLHRSSMFDDGAVSQTPVSYSSPSSWSTGVTFTCVREYSTTSLLQLFLTEHTTCSNHSWWKLKSERSMIFYTTFLSHLVRWVSRIMIMRSVTKRKAPRTLYKSICKMMKASDSKQPNAQLRGGNFILQRKSERSYILNFSQSLSLSIPKEGYVHALHHTEKRLDWMRISRSIRAVMSPRGELRLVTVFRTKRALWGNEMSSEHNRPMVSQTVRKKTQSRHVLLAVAWKSLSL